MTEAIAPTSIHRVAVVQAEPEWLNLPACVSKTISLIQAASRQGASLIAFPECWIPGYPAWIWSRPVDHKLAISYIKNSLSQDSAEMASICACAKENSIVVVLGFSENSHNSLYIAQNVISATGEILMHRRKLKPTHMERTVFGDASGGSLDNVVEAGSIGRVGSLSCWEHTQPLLKYHTMSQREDIHVAAWPPLFPHSGNSMLKEDLFSLSKDGCSVLSQAYAIESGCFVLHATSVLTAKGLAVFKNPPGTVMSTEGGGGSAVFGPDGQKLSEDFPAAEEGLVVVDVEYDDLLRNKAFLDVVGHYSRPDLLRLMVDRVEKKCVEDC